jgi:hypothetical protein
MVILAADEPYHVSQRSRDTSGDREAKRVTLFFSDEAPVGPAG